MAGVNCQVRRTASQDFASSTVVLIPPNSGDTHLFLQRYTIRTVLCTVFEFRVLAPGRTARRYGLGLRLGLGRASRSKPGSYGIRRESVAGVSCVVFITSCEAIGSSIVAIGIGGLAFVIRGKVAKGIDGIVLGAIVVRLPVEVQHSYEKTRTVSRGPMKLDGWLSCGCN